MKSSVSFTVFEMSTSRAFELANEIMKVLTSLSDDPENPISCMLSVDALDDQEVDDDEA